MTDTTDQTLVQKLTAQIIAAYVKNNSVSEQDLGDLIGKVKEAFVSLASPPVPVADEKPTPAVHPKKSVFPDYIICLEDGKKLKLLRRHLKSAYGLTPQAYRERWGLPAEYPMVAPNYAKHRSSLAHKIGLGHRRGSDDS